MSFLAALEYLSTIPLPPRRRFSYGEMGRASIYYPLVGLLIGLVLGMVIAFIVETFDTSLGAIEDVEEILETQVLGVIPRQTPRISWRA